MRTLALLAVLALALLPGCSGGGASVPIINIPGQNFNLDRAGSWTARTTDNQSQTSGTLTLSIASDHSLTGTWQTDAGAIWTITGSVSPDPTFTTPPDYGAALTFTSPGQTTLFGSGTLSVSPNTGHLVGHLQEERPNPPNQHGILVLDFTINLTRQ